MISNRDFVSTGRISADGGAGTGDTTGACASGGIPTTGGPAPRGGGAGGMIVVAGRTMSIANYADLSAEGGAGGASRTAPSGGGAGGIVITMGTRNPPEVMVPEVNGGAAGTNLCPGDGASVNAEAGGYGWWALVHNVYPGITTQASAASPAGVHDVATLLAAGPTGTVTFRLFSDEACTNQVFTSTNPVTDATATSGNYMPTAAGTYYWTAEYSGDGVNMPVTSPCNAPNKSVTVARPAPPSPPGPRRATWPVRPCATSPTCRGRCARRAR